MTWRPSYRHVDWERRLTELHWHAAALRQGAKARWSLRRARRTGRRAHVLGWPTVDASDLEVGDDFRVWSGHRTTLLSGGGRLRFGDRVFVNCGTVIIAVEEIVVGDDVAFAHEVLVLDSDSHGVEGRPHRQAPVRIGDGCWLGARSTVLPGVTLGRRVLVAAGAVVTRDVPDDVLVAGNPARVVRPLHYPPGCRRAWHDADCPCPRLDGEAARQPSRQASSARSEPPCGPMSSIPPSAT
ncbi:MAG: acyltransferase [Actinomycetota bacterium]|nr:acyltransferase [Actinomycetota bacterium]